MYLSEDDLDVKRIASKLGAQAGKGCISTKAFTLYKCGKIQLRAKSNSDAAKKTRTIIRKLDKLQLTKELRIVALGQVIRNSVAKVYCPNTIAMLEIVRREALDLLDSFAFPEESRDEVARLISEEIFSDVIFSNFVLSSEQFGDPVKLRKTGNPRIFKGWLVIDFETKNRMLQVYEKRIRGKVATIILKKTSVYDRVKSILRDKKGEIIKAIVTGLITEAIVQVIVAAVSCTHKPGSKNIDRYKTGKILKARRRITSKHLSALLKWPEPIILLELNSLVKGESARIIDRELRLYEFASDRVALSIGWSPLGEVDYLKYSKVFEKTLGKEKVTRLNRLIKKDKFPTPQISSIVSVLEKEELLETYS